MRSSNVRTNRPAGLCEITVICLSRGSCYVSTCLFPRDGTTNPQPCVFLSSQSAMPLNWGKVWGRIDVENILLFAERMKEKIR
jgi:hypothetical protein